MGIYSYDPKLNILKICKIQVNDEEFDILRDIKVSYRNFVENQIYKDANYLAKIMERTINDGSKGSMELKTIRVVTEVGAKHPGPDYIRESMINVKMYYPVYGTFYVSGVKASEKIEICRIPYMDEDCILNVDGKRRVIIAAMQDADDISVTVEKLKKLIQLTVGNRKLIIKSPSDNKLVFSAVYNGSKDQPLDVILNSFLFQNSIDDVDIYKLYSNEMILNSLTKKDLQLSWVKRDESEKTHHSTVFADEDCIVNSHLREILNTTLSIDKSIGMTLSRDIILPRENRILNKGLTITQEMISSLKYNLINEVYVKSLPKFDKIYIAEKVEIYEIKRGFELTPYLKEKIPEKYRKFNYAPKDIVLEKPVEIVKGELALDHIMKLLYDMGREEILLSSSKQCLYTKVFKFEQEFVGNNFHRVGDFVEPENIPADFDADAYIYIKDINNYIPVSKKYGDYITAWDVLGFVSLAGRSFTKPHLREVFNTDIDFLKRIDLVGDTLSAMFRAGVRKHLNKYKLALLKQLGEGNIEEKFFIGFSHAWYRELWDSKLMKIVEDTNPVARIAQVRRVTSEFRGKTATDKERGISPGYFGRICPFETPEGQKTGIVNSLAYGCRIENGIPKTGFRKLVLVGGKKRVSDRILYMSVKEEAQCRVGDIMSLEFDTNGNILNTMVKAKVPDLTGTSMSKLSKISAYDLEYVLAHPEQSISISAQLIPCASHDDAVRISLGVPRLKQAISLQGSEAPLVLTSTYRTLFNGNESFVIKAKNNGVVLDITKTGLVVQYDGQDLNDVEEMPVPQIKISDNCVVMMNCAVQIGQRFEKGDLLVDSTLSKSGMFSPGVNLLTAYLPYRGWNYEDSACMSKSATSKFVSMSNDIIEENINYASEIQQNGISDSSGMRYVMEDSNFLELKRNKYEKGKLIGKGSSRWINSGRNSGLLYSTNVETDERGKSKIVCKLMGFNALRQGDKTCGRHANKGVTPTPIPDGSMPMISNGKVVEFIGNPAGINSRMNMGQMLECSLGLCAKILDIYIESNSFNGASIDDIYDMLKFTWSCCNESVETAYSKYDFFPKELKDKLKSQQNSMYSWKGCFNEKGQARIRDQVTGTWFENPVTIGYTYMLKLVQEVDDKMHARSAVLEEPYNYMSKQPPKGSSSLGGQKIGEMETISVAAHGAANVLYEMYNVKSDNVKLRELSIAQALGLTKLEEELIDIIDNYGAEPFALTTLRSYLEACDFILETDNRYPFDSNERLNIKDVNFSKAVAESGKDSDTNQEDIENFESFRGKIKLKL